MLLSRQKNTEKNRDIKILNSSYENETKFKYLGTTVENLYLIQENLTGDRIRL